jgi:hypothetical protein
VNEILILPEMLEAGVEALTEARSQGLADHETAAALYLAMEAVREIFVMRNNGMVH